MPRRGTHRLGQFTSKFKIHNSSLPSLQHLPHVGEEVLLELRAVLVREPGKLAHREVDRGQHAHLQALRVVLGYTHADTHSDTGADLHGFFHSAHLDEAAPWWRQAHTYLCGPQGLMDSVGAAFDSAGIGEQLHTEVFTPPALKIDTENAIGQVRFSHSGAEIDNSGKPLLEQAEDAGLRPEHGCRMGICFSCTKVKTSGCVRNALTGDLSTNPDEEIQMCISVPLGDVEINC
jgi:stearoyl-CoA 9-desaturase NADPH oxidoreductase